MNWIQKVVNEHADMESPQAFWYWSAMAALSAVVKDQVWINRKGKFRTYPNIYVMLYARSGLRKGTPVALAKRIVSQVNNTRIISGRSSIQGIVKDLGTAYTIPGTGKVMNKSVGFIVASEFSSSIVNDPAAMNILTDLYDRQYNAGEWRSLLKMDSFNLKDPTITLLVATNEAHFGDLLEKKDIEGGFIGRMFLIAENKVNKLNPLVGPADSDVNDDKLADYPKEVSQLTGEFKFTKPALELYNEWYYPFYKSLEEQEIVDETGTIERLGDSVLKVAMLLSLATDLSLTITEDNIGEAVNACERLVGNVRKATIGKKGMAEDANKKALILKELMVRENHQVTREIMLKKHWMHFNSEDLDKLALSFESAGIIKISSIGKQILYHMPDTQFQEFKRHFEGGSSILKDYLKKRGVI